MPSTDFYLRFLYDFDHCQLTKTVIIYLNLVDTSSLIVFNVCRHSMCCLQIVFDLQLMSKALTGDYCFSASANCPMDWPSTGRHFTIFIVLYLLVRPQLFQLNSWSRKSFRNTEYHMLQRPHLNGKYQNPRYTRNTYAISLILILFHFHWIKDTEEQRIYMTPICNKTNKQNPNENVITFAANPSIWVLPFVDFHLSWRNSNAHNLQLILCGRHYRTLMGEFPGVQHA